MGWAIWRTKARDAIDDARAKRDGDTPDAAHELRLRTRRRLIGAAALLLGAVIVVPTLLDQAPRSRPDAVRITMPAKAEQIQPIAPAAAVSQPEPAVVAAVSDDPKVAEPAAPTTKGNAVEPVPVAPAASTATAAANEKYALQVAALSTTSAANQLVARLKKAGFDAYVEQVRTSEGPRHRVRLGPFSGRDDAQRVGEKLRKAGFAAALVAA